MPKIITEEITTLQVDAIVNSLGIGEERILKRPGRVFASILAKAGDPLAKEVYDKGVNLDFTECFITSSYGLPCKYIVHVITPFKKDDVDQQDLSATYEGALDEAYAFGIRSIAVPLLGTGANGYRSVDSFIAARNACESFEKIHPDMKIFLDAFWGIKKDPYYANMRFSADPSRTEAVEEESFYDEYDEERVRRLRLRGLKLVEQPFPNGEPLDPQEVDFRRLPLRFGDSLGRLFDLFFMAQNGSDDPKRLNDKWNELQEGLTNTRAMAAGLDPDHIEGGELAGQNLKNRWHKKAPAGTKKSKGVKYGAEDPNGVWTHPDRFILLLACMLTCMTPKQTEFTFKFCGYYLSRYDLVDVAIKECMGLLSRDGVVGDYIEAFKIYEAFTGKNAFAPNLAKGLNKKGFTKKTK